MKRNTARLSVIAAATLAAGFAAAGQASAEAPCRIDGGAVYFSHEDASLNAESKAALTRIAAEARACDAAAVLVRTGAGDLGEQRAQTIAAELSTHGVAVTRAISLSSATAASEDFIPARVAEIEIRARGQSVS